MASIPERFPDLLTQKAPLAYLATIMPDGSPHVTPVWFDFADGKMRINTVCGRVKERNMARDARVALSVVDPDDSDRHIQLRGVVNRMTEVGAIAHNNALARKYLGLDVYPYDKPGDIHVLVEIVPMAIATLG
ncbi:MAG: PPOX class F420-dependent oxidoreductase [Acetobacteraceae bacterium]|jgi:PPOX class probable F420-dependent enzyme